MSGTVGPVRHSFKPAAVWGAAAAVAIACSLYASFTAPAIPPAETIDLSDRSAGAPPLCPWREPEADLKAFFPGATGYSTETLVLSSLRTQVTARLGPGVPLRSNTLQIYRVERSARNVGTVLVDRAAGEHGAIEVVVGVDTDGYIVAVRLQRLREPPAIAAALTSPAWLRAFRGKVAADAFGVGADLPAVTPPAERSASAIARAVRTLLVKHEVASVAAAARPRAGHH